MSTDSAPAALARSPLGLERAAPLLQVERLSAGYDDRVILRNITFDVPRHGIVGILGPTGVGKSTLMRTLARFNDALPYFWSEGRILYEGRDLQKEMSIEEAHRHVALVAQKNRLFTATVLDNVISEVRPKKPLTWKKQRELTREVLEPLGLWEELEPHLDEQVVSLPIGVQRKINIARLTAGGASCLLADEPLRDLSQDESDDLERFIMRFAETHAIVMVTHNQGQARRMCSTVALISAGQVVESGPAGEFWHAPKTALGQEYLRVGTCWPAADDELLKPEAKAPLEATKAPHPGGFHWIVVGALGGMQRPGIARDEAMDLSGLSELGCKLLVSLTEETYDPEKLDPYGIAGAHFPIVDMSVPTLEDAATLCRRVSASIDRGEPVVLHCKAGLGRTGTMLSAVLIYRGEDAVRAIDRVRSINPYYIQSEEQLRFIGEFGDYIAKTR